MLATVLMNMTLLTSVLCQQAAIGGALAGLVVGALRGLRAGKDASKNMGFFNKVGTMVSATVHGARIGSIAGAALGAVGMYAFLHGKSIKDGSKCDNVKYLRRIYKDVYLDKSTFIRENQWSESLT